MYGYITFIMIRDLKCLYVVIKNNEVVYFETNLYLFVHNFKKIEPEIKSYSYYNSKFKERNIIPFVNKNREIHFFQKVL